jgi:ATP-dependent helicase HrpA
MAEELPVPNNKTSDSLPAINATPSPRHQSVTEPRRSYALQTAQQSPPSDDAPLKRDGIENVGPRGPRKRKPNTTAAKTSAANTSPSNTTASNARSSNATAQNTLPSNSSPGALFDRLEQVSVFDAARLRKRIHRARSSKGDVRAKELAKVAGAISHAEIALAKRAAGVPVVTVPSELPIADRADDIAALVRDHQVVVVAGETGSGKSTQLPKICLALGRGVRGLIAHTQPRRLAARTIAERVAEELGSKVGETVGYKVRFTDEVSERTSIKLMTDGILLAEIQRDPLLLRYDTIIVDEAHERSLNIDFLLGYLHTLLPRRPDLKLIITSATIDTARIAAHFGNAPIIEVSGRMFPVEIRYRPLDGSGDTNAWLVSNDEALAVNRAPHIDDDEDEELDAFEAEEDSEDDDAAPPRDLRGDGYAAEPRSAGNSQGRSIPGRSSTAQNKRSSKHDGAAPGKRTTKPGSSSEGRDQNQAIVEAVRELMLVGAGDILVFLSGEREIRDAAETLSGAKITNLEIVPLYARLSSSEQHRVFSQHAGRRVVLATNVAETSLTVPGVRYVVDAGTARISRYSKRTKVQRLPIERISQASANQRAGRCGRVGPGVCIRLYAQSDFTGRDAFTEPEIQRTNLASVILQMASMGLGDIASFPFVDPPDLRSIRDGVALLEELRAVDPAAEGTDTWLTPIGKQLSVLPVDPRLGRMLIEAAELGAVNEMTIIAAALSIVDPRERPQDKTEQARAAHSEFAHPESDFGGWLKLWDFLREEKSTRSSSRFRKLCKENFLNWLRVREWQDIRAQLLQATTELGWQRNNTEATLDIVHRCVIPGLLSQIGHRDVKGAIVPAQANAGRPVQGAGKRAGPTEYRGTRNNRFVIAPGSVLSKKNPEWVMAAELTETNRLYARCVGPISPTHIERAAAHLVTRSHTTPKWDEERGSATITERVTLYGLTVVGGRSVQLSRIDPSAARELFIRHALIDGNWPSLRVPHAFVEHNLHIRAQVDAMGARLRRNLVVEDAAQWSFFDARLPIDVVSVSHFDKWWRQEARHNPTLFNMTLDDLLANPDDEPKVDPSPVLGAAARDLEAANNALQHPKLAGFVPSGQAINNPALSSFAAQLARFPDSWQQGSLEFPLTYVHAPASRNDGITIDIPVAALSVLDTAALSWSVPGHRVELLEELIRSLPKNLRRQFVPVVDTATEIRRQLEANGEWPSDTASGPTSARQESQDATSNSSGAAGLGTSVSTTARVDVLTLLARELDRRSDVRITSKDFRPDELPAYLRLTYRVLDADGKELASSKSLDDLRAELRQSQAEAMAAAPLPASVPVGTYTAWEFDSIPRVIALPALTGSLNTYPALHDLVAAVEVRRCATQLEQYEQHRLGLRRLLRLAFTKAPRDLERALSNRARLSFSTSPWGSLDAWSDDCVNAGVDECLRRFAKENPSAAPDGLLWERSAFVELRLFTNKALYAILNELATATTMLAGSAAAITEALPRLKLMPDVTVDIRAHIDRLAYPGCLAAVGVKRIDDLVRYAVGIERRLDRVVEKLAQDRSMMARCQALEAEYDATLARTGPTEELDEAIWMLEEFRISSFAQSVGVKGSVSDKRIRSVLGRSA